MQAYSASFARLYNLRWGGFAQRVAPIIRDLYESTPLGKVNRSLLDLCCGTGQLAVHFLFAQEPDLRTPVADPEQYGRAFVVAAK